MLSSILAGSDPLFGANSRGIIVFGFEIYYYALAIVGGMLVATVLSALLMKRRNMSYEFIYLLFIVCIPSALVCARLFYCITDGMHIKYWFMWDDGMGHGIRNGGLSVIGGVIGGVLAGFLVCVIKKVDFFRAADCVVVNILVAQALGRWGNFFNAEVYGNPVTDPALQWFPFAVPISPNSGAGGLDGFGDPSATWYYALFFYEMVFSLIGWALLFSFTWYRKKKPNGISACLYFVWYGIVRIIMEPLRNSNYILGNGGIMWSEVFAALYIIAGLGGIALLLLRNYKKEGALIGSKTGDPCGITHYLTPYKDDIPYFSKINIFGANYPPKPPKGERGKSGSASESEGDGEPPQNDGTDDGEPPQNGDTQEGGTRDENKKEDDV